MKNLETLYRKLIQVARSNPPTDQVPYAFEQRILARLRTEPLTDLLTLWARALWRAAIPCVGIMLLFGAWSTLGPQPSADLESADLGTELESTLMASVSIESELVW